MSVNQAINNDMNFKMESEEKGCGRIWRQYKWYGLVVALLIVFNVIIISTLISMNGSSSSSSSSAWSNMGECDDQDEVLTMIYSRKFKKIFSDTMDVSKFEASGMAYDSSNGGWWVVFDSLYALGFTPKYWSSSSSNKLIKSKSFGLDNDGDDPESGFEGITKYNGKLYVATESREFDDGYHPLIRTEYYSSGSKYTESSICAAEWEAPSENKGFEGLNVIKISGNYYLLGLAEKDGTLVLMDIDSEDSDGDIEDAGIDCVYSTIGEFDPPTSKFDDYSAMHFAATSTSNVFNVAVVSQEESKVWIGKARWSSAKKGPSFYSGETYEFPQESSCDTKLCNVEGIYIKGNYLYAVSDKMKKDQSDDCEDFDQSFHVFSMP